MKEKYNKILGKIAQFGYDHPKACGYAGSITMGVGLFLYAVSCSMNGCRRADEHWQQACKEVLASTKTE